MLPGGGTNGCCWCVGVDVEYWRIRCEVVITGSSVHDGGGMLFVVGATGYCGSCEWVVKIRIYTISACDYRNIPPRLSSVFPAFVSHASIHDVCPGRSIFVPLCFGPAV